MISLRRHWGRITFVASLALNVFFIAAIATHWFGQGERDFAGDPDDGSLVVGLPSPHQLYGALTEDEQELLTAEWKTRKPQFKEIFDAIFDARASVAMRLDAEDFQKPALTEAFAELRRHQMTLTATSQDVIIDLAAELDAEGRESLADLMRPRNPPLPARDTE